MPVGGGQRFEFSLVCLERPFSVLSSISQHFEELFLPFLIGWCLSGEKSMCPHGGKWVLGAVELHPEEAAS